MQSKIRLDLTAIGHDDRISTHEGETLGIVILRLLD